MTETELLRDYLDSEQHNLFCYSANREMTRAKDGFDREFREARERCLLLELMLYRAQGMDAKQQCLRR